MSSNTNEESIVAGLIKGFGLDHPTSKRLQDRDLTIIGDFESMQTPEVIKRPIINGLLKEWGLLVEDDETASKFLDDISCSTTIKFDTVEKETLIALKAIADAGVEDEVDVSILTNLARIDTVGCRLKDHLEHQLRFRGTIIHLLETFKPGTRNETQDNSTK